MIKVRRIKHGRRHHHHVRRRRAHHHHVRMRRRRTHHMRMRHHHVRVRRVPRCTAAVDAAHRMRTGRALQSGRAVRSVRRRHVGIEVRRRRVVDHRRASVHGTRGRGRGRRGRRRYEILIDARRRARRRGFAVAGAQLDCARIVRPKRKEQKGDQFTLDRRANTKKINTARDEISRRTLPRHDCLLSRPKSAGRSDVGQPGP